MIYNNSLKIFLENNIKDEKISHAYLFYGDHGTGKLFVAKNFAKKILNNNNKNNLESGDKCCDPDLIIIDKDSIVVDDIKNLIKDIYIKPFENNYKFFILKMADFTQQAQNALLKILEDPPKYIIFILISDDIKIFLETIISRCIVLKTKLISKNKIKKILKLNFELKEEEIEIYSNYANGSIGRAIEVIRDNEFLIRRDTIISLIKKILFLDSSESLLLIDEIEKFKYDDLLNITYYFIYDLIMFKKTRNKNRIINIDKLKEIDFISQKIKTKRLLFISKQISKYFRYINNSVNLKLVFINLAINLSDQIKN
ncbi:MAG: hypothetical protein LBJ93_00180 [Clostridiales bacterium]|nr:hypothetical protein [Clostridiales bacterium]